MRVGSMPWGSGTPHRRCHTRRYCHAALHFGDDRRSKRGNPAAFMLRRSNRDTSPTPHIAIRCRHVAMLPPVEPYFRKGMDIFRTRLRNTRLRKRRPQGDTEHNPRSAPHMHVCSATFLGKSLCGHTGKDEPYETREPVDVRPCPLGRTPTQPRLRAHRATCPTPDRNAIPFLQQTRIQQSATHHGH